MRKRLLPLASAVLLTACGGGVKLSAITVSCDSQSACSGQSAPSDCTSASSATILSGRTVFVYWAEDCSVVPPEVFYARGTATLSSSSSAAPTATVSAWTGREGVGVTEVDAEGGKAQVCAAIDSNGNAKIDLGEPVSCEPATAEGESVSTASLTKFAGKK